MFSSFRFSKNLTPTIFTSCLYPQYSQFVSWELQIMVTKTIGKKKIRFLIDFGYCLLFKNQFVLCED